MLLLFPIPASGKSQAMPDNRFVVKVCNCLLTGIPYYF